MTHQVKVTSCKRIANASNTLYMVTRIITIDIDGIIVTGIVTYEGLYSSTKLRKHNVYRLKLDNKDVAKHKDYKEIRLQILREMYKIDSAMCFAVIERTHGSGHK